MASPLIDSTDTEDTQPGGIHSAMKSVFDDLADTRQGIQGDLGITTPASAMTGGYPGAGGRPSTDALALSMGLNGTTAPAPRESHLDRARRILSGEPAPTSSGDINMDNAIGVSNLRTRLAADRNYRMNVAGNIPNANTTPEMASNELNYLDMMTLRGAGDPLGDAESPGMRTRLNGQPTGDMMTLNLDGPQGSLVDQRRARVESMADQGATMSTSPAEINRRALIAAMNPVTVPDPADPTKTITRPPTPQEAMLGFSRSGGTGLSMDAVMRAIDSQEMANKKKGAGGALGDFTGMIDAYKDALSKKDYLAARFLAQKMGHKFEQKDPDTGEIVPFSPEQLPGYTADGAPASGAAVVPAAAAAATNPSAEAIAHLKGNPDLAAAFDAKYGAGSAQKALGK